MKLAVGVMLLSTMSLGNVHAAEPNAPAKPSLNRGQEKLVVAHQDLSTEKKMKTPRGKKANTKGKTDRMAKDKQDTVTEPPSESTEQSVQLRGVRG